MITGSIYKTGDSLRFQGQVVDVRTGKTLRSIEDVVGPASDPLVGIRAVRERLMGGLAMSDRRATGLLIANAPRYDAYQEYLRGMDLFTHQDYRGAMPLLRHAAALDPTFVAPHSALATAHSNLGEWAAADSIVKLSEQLRPTMSRPDRAMLDWQIGNIKGDLEGTFNMSLAMWKRDSSWVSLWLAAFHGIYIGHPRKTIELLNIATPPVGWVPNWTVLAAAYHEIGDHRNELRVAQQGDSAYPGRVALLLSVVNALAAQGEAARVRALVDSVSHASTDPLWPAGQLMLRGALELRAHGHESEAAALLDQARASLATRPPDGLRLRVPSVAPPPRFSWRAGSSIRRSSATPASPPRIVASLVSWSAPALHLRSSRGDTATAKRMNDSLSKVVIPYSFGEIPFWRATIAASLGDKETAVRLINDALAAGARRMPEIHRTQEFQSLRGYGPFEAILRPKG